MKTIILALLLPLLMYSQEDYESKYQEDCRSLCIEALNLIHDHDFKAYPKQSNLVMDIDFDTNCHSGLVNNRTMESMKSNAKETTYDVVSKDMPSIIRSNDLCNFSHYVFNIVYKSDDKKYYTYTYYLDAKELYEIKDHITKSQVFKLMLYKE